MCPTAASRRSRTFPSRSRKAGSSPYRRKRRRLKAPSSDHRGARQAKSGRILLNGEDLLKLEAQDIVSRGITLVPARQESLSRPQRGGKFENRRISSRRRYFRGRQTDLRPLPPPERTERQMAGTLSGGEQQMSGGGEGAHVKAKASDDGRTVPGPRAPHRAGHFRHHQGNQGPGRHHFAHRAKREPCPPAANFGYVIETGASKCPDRAGNFWKTRKSRRLIWKAKQIIKKGRGINPAPFLFY